MSIRRLVLVALLANVGVAQADVVSSAPPHGTFLTSWTAGNGADVIGSGVLSGNVSLVGGISHTARSANASIEDVLLGKVSASQVGANGTQLFYQSGIQGNYLLGSDNGMLAVRLGNSTSVVNTDAGVAVLNGAPVPGQGILVGPGAGNVGGGAGGGAATSNGGNASAGAGGGTGGIGDGGIPAAGGAVPGLDIASGVVPGAGLRLGAEIGSGAGAGAGADVDIGSGTGAGHDIGKPDQALVGAQDNSVAAIPEPSSIALVLAGLLGAGTLGRRRKQ